MQKVSCFAVHECIGLLFEWICKQYNIMAECSDKTEKTHSEYFVLGN